MESKEYCGISVKELSKNDAVTQKIIGLLSLLSKPDAFRVFILAGDGIRSQVDTPPKIGLTKKQYYSRLEQLVRAGLLTKNEGVYRQTTFGTIICCNYLLKLGIEIMNSRYMEMIDVIQYSSKINKEEIGMISSKIRGSMFENVK